MKKQAVQSELVLKVDHLFARYDSFGGKKISKYPLGNKKVIINLIKESIMNMKPAPDLKDVYVSDDEINVLWYLPVPIFIASLDELDNFDDYMNVFLRTNPVAKGKSLTSYQEECSEDLQKEYEFYKNLGIKMVFEGLKA